LSGSCSLVGLALIENVAPSVFECEEYVQTGQLPSTQTSSKSKIRYMIRGVMSLRLI